MTNFKRFDSYSNNVWKYVFEFDQAIAEAVLYRYNTFEDRTVICCSVQSGCPVGCTFCGTGNRFIRNLTSREIEDQIITILMDQHISPSMCKKFQIMFMSMGEPFLNYVVLENIIIEFARRYPNAQLLVSTIAPNSLSNFGSYFILLSRQYNQVGLQFSLHATTDEERNKIIPFKHKYTIKEMCNYGIMWWLNTSRKPYINYCVTDKFSNQDIENIKNIFPPQTFCITLSVLCSPDETAKDAGYRNLDRIREIESNFLSLGYNTRIFDPAGQDDIGGGCGQLWYVQRKLKEIKNAYS